MLMEVSSNGPNCDMWPARDIAVDLDGSLLKTDTLVEGFVWAFFHQPRAAIGCLLSLPKGRAAVKLAICEISAEGASTYPVRQDLCDWLIEQKGNGRRLHLVTAAHRTVADKVADRLDLFDSVMATDGAVNFKGANKSKALDQKFPEGWSYVGDCHADLPIFAKAKGAILAGHKNSLQRKVEKSDTPIEASFPTNTSGIMEWAKACRVHQWSKNLLVFIPLLLSGSFMQPGALLNTVLAFFLLSFCASGTYLLNDLADLRSDRTHRTKKHRSLAAANVRISSALFFAALLIAGSMAIAFALIPQFAILLLIYTATTLGYSAGLKRVAMFDVFILASLFTLRLAMGAVAAAVPLSGWLAGFSVAFFLSLSLAKRATEIVKYQGEETLIPGRGYRKGDLPLVMAFGISSGMVALLLMILFLVFAAFTNTNYADPKYLLSAPPLIFLWISRVWILATRGELKDDPVVFAVKDVPSLALGALMGLATLVAVVGFNP